MEIIKELAKSLEREIQWFEAVVATALSLHFNREHSNNSVYEHAPPDLKNDNSVYAKMITDLELGFEGRIVLIIAVLPLIRPQALDVFLIRNQNLDAYFSEFGGSIDNKRRRFIPTLETAVFVLAGDSIEERLRLMKHFQMDHSLFLKGILKYDNAIQTELHQPLEVSNEFLEILSNDTLDMSRSISGIPIREISTEIDWSDLVLEKNVIEQLHEIKDWAVNRKDVLDSWGLNKYISPGYKALFYGPPGTGKTLAAKLIGKSGNLPVMKMDLSLIMTKYIGETEKNLSKIFSLAEDKDWILFFDEADALFGKRSEVKNSNDRFANQEVAYLLQRIEDHRGIVILASNNNYAGDEAFNRRFQDVIHFPVPGMEQRLLLWQRLFGSAPLDEEISLEKIAEDFELSGGDIIEVLRYCMVATGSRTEKKIELRDIQIGIKRVYNRSNKII